MQESLRVNQSINQ